MQHYSVAERERSKEKKATLDFNLHEFVFLKFPRKDSMLTTASYLHQASKTAKKLKKVHPIKQKQEGELFFFFRAQKKKIIILGIEVFKVKVHSCVTILYWKKCNRILKC